MPRPKKFAADPTLEDQEWYHGYRPRRDIKPILILPGDFLVRSTDLNRDSTAVVVTMLNADGKMAHLTLSYTNKLWHLKPKKSTAAAAAAAAAAGTSSMMAAPIARAFDTVAELLAHYKKKGGFSRHLPLKRAVLRPGWMLKHAAVTYREEDRLGSGNFCHVYKGRLKLPSETAGTPGTHGRTVAIKKSHAAQGADAETEAAKEARRDMLREASVMSYYLHDNVIKFFGVACDRVPILVVMELCPGGDLQSHLARAGAKMTTAERLLYAVEASRGMQYLHARGCVHCDLAARNCLISAKGVLKIADFGLSKLIKEKGEGGKDEDDEDDEKPISAKAHVPVRWMAPESLRKPQIFTKETDVWSYAMLLYEIFTNGSKPWADDLPKKVATAIRNCKMPDLPDATPKTVKDLVARIWVLDPSERPKMSSVASRVLAAYRAAPVADAARLTFNQLAGVRREAVKDADLRAEDEEDGGRCGEDEGEDTSTREASRTRTPATASNTSSTDGSPYKSRNSSCSRAKRSRTRSPASRR